MNTLPEHTLPLATTSPFTRWAHSALPVRGEWSKALDEARSAGTSGFPVQEWPGRDPALQGNGGGVPCPSRTMRSHPAMPAAASGDQATDRGEHCSGHHHLANLDAPQAPCAAGTYQAEPPDSPLSQTACSASRRAPAVRDVPERPSLHVHVEQHADGAAVWLGIPATFGSKDTASLCAALRQLAGAGMPLARLTCNGRSVYDRIDTFPESP